ncbi:hypothetical protein SB48_HM08orf00185 [Heyndrickxia coagulans]|uniref:Uncharacterized protein n=1 Tax=Heyndrickxia coagulans TaxID=1398 RepID=A0AAN0T3D5_HEYCO|nr:hypothetical protein SB48_HM08orf00185 [Heyndrickxia coagulans]
MAPALFFFCYGRQIARRAIPFFFISVVKDISGDGDSLFVFHPRYEGHLGRRRFSFCPSSPL